MNKSTALSPNVDITIDDKKCQLVPSFKNLAKIEKDLGMGFLAYLKLHTALNDEELHRSLDIPLTDIFIIFKNSLDTEFRDEELEDFIVENFIYCLEQCFVFLNSSLREGKTKSSEKEDAKKKN